MAMRAPPGTGRNTLGFSLGSTGGARGTGAGLSREVVLRFITSYDRGRLEALSRDLEKLNAAAIANAEKVANLGKREQQLQQLATQQKAARNKLDLEGQVLLQNLQQVQNKLAGTSVNERKVRQGIRLEIEKAREALMTSTGLTRDQVSILMNLRNLDAQRRALNVELTAAQRQQLALDEQINAAELQRNTIINKSMAALRGVRGLLLGAVGGIIGGAIIGTILFEPIQGALDAITNWAKNIIDPAHNARDALKDVAAQVKDIASKENITNLDAANKLITGLGGLGGAAGIKSGPLAQAAETQRLKDILDQIEKFQQQGKFGESLLNDQRARGLNLLLRQSSAYQDIANYQRSLGHAVSQVEDLLKNVPDELARGSSYAGLSVQQMQAFITAANDAGLQLNTAANSSEELAAATNDAAEAAAKLRDELAQVAVGDIGTAAIDDLTNKMNVAIDTARQTADFYIEGIRSSAENAANRVQSGADRRIQGIQDQMSQLSVQPSARTRGLERGLQALSDSGPSQRTKALADQIERINKAQERFQYLQQLSDISEQRHAIILARRLSLQEKEINIYRFQGKDRLIAIDAELERIQKRNDAQDRFNKLLDIEYQFQKGVQRTSGESIRDFIERRAQFYRGLINETTQLNRAGQTDTLQKEKDRVEYEVKLRENAEQRKQVISERARQVFMARLQKELQASQDGDRKALESRRRSLQAQLEASKKADQSALESRRRALQHQIDAVRANAKSEIDSINRRRDADIKSREVARDRAIQQSRITYEALIKTQEKLTRDLGDLASQQWTDARSLAIRGTNSLAELERAAGRFGGSEYSYGLLLGQIDALGLPPDQARALLAHAASVRSGYLEALMRLSKPDLGYHPHGQGRAKGGIFELTNALNLGQNTRAGEEGPELGVILSNKVVQAMRENNQNGPMVGNVTFQTQDAYRDRYLFRKMVKEIVRDELRH